MYHLPSIYPDTLVSLGLYILKYNSARGISCVCVYLVSFNRDKTREVKIYLMFDQRAEGSTDDNLIIP